MKKLIALTFFALSLLATAQTSKTDTPLPTCDPCPWVR